jgi:uncharacterized protein (DUF2237 family)
MTVAILSFQFERGIDLITPRPEHHFQGLKPGDRWCVCALRWKEAWLAGCAPPVALARTRARTTDFVSLACLQENALNGVG